MKVYAATYCPDTSTAAFGVISLHKTLEGANAALKVSKDRCKSKLAEDVLRRIAHRVKEYELKD